MAERVASCLALAFVIDLAAILGVLCWVVAIVIAKLLEHWIDALEES